MSETDNHGFLEYGSVTIGASFTTIVSATVTIETSFTTIVSATVIPPERVQREREPPMSQEAGNLQLAPPNLR